jgi:hypothetical protein
MGVRTRGGDIRRASSETRCWSLARAAWASRGYPTPWRRRLAATATRFSDNTSVRLSEMEKALPHVTMEEDHAALRRIDFALAEHGETTPNGADDYRRLRTLRPSIARPLGLQIAHLAGQRIMLDHRRRRWRTHVNLRSVAVLNDDDEPGLRQLVGCSVRVEAQLHRFEGLQEDKAEVVTCECRINAAGCQSGLRRA